MADLQTPTANTPVDTPSTSTSNNYPNYNFDVFISHRGPDVKNSFAAHLYRDLHARGLQTFLDREELQGGELIDPQIEGAIRSAYIHIIIFSPGYADSRWCLDELVLIWKKSKDIIIPVFYKVQPSEPRWAKKGRYAEALAKHERRYDHQTLENWRNALNGVSYRVGFELDAYNGNEVTLLEKVVECVLENRRNRRKTALYVDAHPTGLQSKVEDFENKVLLQQQKNDTARVVGIVGLGGVGKTTLAKELFNRKSCDFKQSCVLYDVREIASRESLIFLQRKLLKGLTNITAQIDTQIDSIEEGIQTLKSHLSSLHVLIVIDDVDHVDQLKALLPVKDFLHSDSLILVTSRSKDVLRRSEISIPDSSIYGLTGLDEQQSRQLFCSYAFLRPYPALGFEYLVDEFCKACSGLPLSLKVLGALVCGMTDKSYWEGQLDKLRQVKLPSDIRERLKISYDALEAEEKQIFIDIACYFIEEDRHMAVRIWDGSGWNGLMGFLNLQGKCLVDVDGDTIKMHDQLRDLGREIAAEENQLRHLWRPTNHIDGLWQQCSVITEVRGIRTVPRLNIHYDEYEESEEEWSWFESLCEEVLGNCLRKLMDTCTPYCFRNLQLVATRDGDLKSILRRVESPNLKWLRWNHCPYTCLPSWIPMKNIRVLEVGGNKLKTLWRAESQAPLALRELKIYAPTLSKFPKSIGRLMHIEKIVVASKSLQALPDSFGDLTNLQTLDLSWSVSLQALPDSFGGLTNLQTLDLSGSESLQALPESFGGLTNLQQLNLAKCKSLQALPDSFGGLTNLQTLDLSWSVSLQALPDSFGGLTNLQKLRLMKCKSLQALPDSFGGLTNLQKLELEDCESLQALPDSFGGLTNLQTLELSYSNSLQALPVSFGGLTNLQTLELSYSNSLQALPDSFGGLTNLQKLRLMKCKSLQALPDSFGGLTNLQTFELSYSNSLQALPDSFGGLTNLQKLGLIECKSLQALPDSFGGLTNLQKLRLMKCKSLQALPDSFGGLTNLQKLDLFGCKSLQALPDSFGGLTNLPELNLYDCESLLALPDSFGYLTNLQQLNLAGCKSLQALPDSFGGLTNLPELNLCECESLLALPDSFGCLTNLQQLNLAGCKSLQALPDSFEGLTNLQKLDLFGCASLQALPDSFGGLTNLQTLDLAWCGSLQALPDSFGGLTNLQTLDLRWCVSLQALPDSLRLLTNLRHLNLPGSESI